MTTGRSTPSRLRFDQVVLLLALATGLPGSILSLVLLWTGDFTPRVQWLLTGVLVASWVGIAFSLRERVVKPLQTLANMLAALAQGDFTLRSIAVRTDDPLGLAMLEVNTLGEVLREQRLGALEATALLRKVMEEIDVAVFAFDDEHRLKLVNRRGEELLRQPAERLLDSSARDLGLDGFLAGSSPRIAEAELPGGTGRWEIRRTDFRQKGLRHQLLVVSDVSRVLREEERQAWKRIIRVLGHEINNSLAPIKSIADSLRSRLRKTQADDRVEDLEEGLGVIAERSDSLSRFMRSYARLARLPPPTRTVVDVTQWVGRVVGIERRMRIDVGECPPIQIRADADQLEQLLINLVRNAVDAASETDGSVRVYWTSRDGHLEVVVEDEGPGLADTSNLFVPFYTTKPNGTGIGLALSLQIAEGHGGTLTLRNRRDRSGCVATLRLPLG